MVQVITRLIVGGAQLSVVGLSEHLRDRWDVSIVCGPETGSEGSLLEQAREVVPLTVIPSLRRQINPLRDVQATVALRRILAQLRPDIVHTHSSKAGIVGRLAAATTGARVVHTVHGWGHTPADSKIRIAAYVNAERIAASFTDATVAVSADVREEGLRRRIGSRFLYEVIPELVDYESSGPDFGPRRNHARRSLGITSGGAVVGWVGRFVPQKDPETLWQTLNAVLALRSDVTVVLVGDGPLRHDLEQVVSASGFAGRVVFAGLRHDARTLYPAFDVLVHPSRWEGQPRVIQEAIAERVPVVATRVSGVSELIDEGETGYMVDPGDARALAQAILAVLDDARVRAPLEKAAVERLAQRNGAKVVARRHHELYCRLLRMRPS